ncbi:MAG: protease complex subunit PrcB family protein [Lachnospiraceae bacterium]
MKKSMLFLALPLCLMILTACAVSRTDEKKIRDVEFTVIDKEDIPQEFLTRIEEAKDGQMRLSYGDKGCLYAARGYGVQETSGYSVTVNRCFETEHKIRIDTSLLGPGKGEKILKRKTCPYVVIKMEYTDKQVEIDK